MQLFVVSGSPRSCFVLITLVAALQAAELVDVLKGDGLFSVFAPTDDAFAKLPEGTVDDLLLPESKDLLTSILTYHVVPGRLLSGDVVSADALPTVNGLDLSIGDDRGYRRHQWRHPHHRHRHYSDGADGCREHQLGQREERAVTPTPP